MSKGKAAAPSFLVDDVIEEGINYTPTAEELKQVSTLAMMQLKLALEIDTMTRQLEAKQNEYKRISEQALPDAMKAAGDMKSFSLSSGMSISIADECRASFRSGLEEKCVAWLDSHRLGGIIKESVAISIDRSDPKKRAKLIAAINKLVDVDRQKRKLDVAWNSMVAVVKDLKKGGKELPAELFSVYEWKRAKIEMPKEPKTKKEESKHGR